MNIFNEDFKKRFDKMNADFTNIACKKDIDKKTERLLAMCKLSEECGELSEVILTSLGYQRQSKLDNYKIEDLEGEIADVIIQTMAIAELFDVDVSKAVLNKMEKVENKLSKY